ncbi:MAG: cation:proton antiporter [Acetobacteraceae bacterium]|nr:cation:proton antiporter [Acetobacteraceae bacterium]
MYHAALMRPWGVAMERMLAVVAGFAFLYSLVGGRLERTPLGSALVFVTYGFLVGPSGLDLLPIAVRAEGLRILAELTLAVVLFSDAAGANLAVLRRNRALPMRLLLIGLPLTLLAGFGAAALLFPALGWLAWALLATMLAPTDAALGKPVVTNPAVPASLREALNVESGLNDGICVPVLLLLLAVAELAGDRAGLEALVAHRFFLEEIGIGGAVGLALGVGGQRAVRLAVQRGWMGETWRPVTVAALALATFGTAQALGGSGFIACFVGGLAAGALSRRRAKHEFLLGAEGMGNAFSLVTWVLFGAAAVGPAMALASTPAVIGYAVLSLTVVRMLPVWIALAGSGTPASARLFLGWFGPRGLASLVFALMVLDAGVPGGEMVIAVVVWTVILSVLAHGMTAAPLAAAFTRGEARNAR